jgi:hypothetical protein
MHYSLLLSMLYVFQAASPPIIRSSKLYTQHLVRARLAAATASVGELFQLTHASGSSSKLDIYQMLCVEF